MADSSSYTFTALRDPDNATQYPINLPTRFVITKDRCPTFVMPGDTDFDPERDAPHESSYTSWGVWDRVTGRWAGKNEAASHFDTYGEAVGWFDTFLAQHAADGTLVELLLPKETTWTTSRP